VRQALVFTNPEEEEAFRMAEKLPTAKISDLTVEVDPVSVDTSLGEVAWATVAITYVSGGVEPTLAIRVPVPAEEADKEREALRRARQLIDHACTFPGLAQPVSAPGILEDTVLEGVTQELGITPPATRPGRGPR
jgi:hypothetical protein